MVALDRLDGGAAVRFVAPGDADGDVFDLAVGEQGRNVRRGDVTVVGSALLLPDAQRLPARGRALRRWGQGSVSFESLTASLLVLLLRELSFAQPAFGAVHPALDFLVGGDDAGLSL